MRHKRLEESTCSETHVFQPFANGRSGAVTKIAQSLTYHSERRSDLAAFSTKKSLHLVKHVPMKRPLHFAPSDRKGKKMSLLFDGAAQGQTSSSSSSSTGQETLVVDLLKELSERRANEFSADVASLFGRLVTVLRPLSYAQLSDVYRNIQDSKTK